MPESKEHEIYMKYFGVFERLSVKLSDEFEQIAALQERTTE